MPLHNAEFSLYFPTHTNKSWAVQLPFTNVTHVKRKSDFGKKFLKGNNINNLFNSIEEEIKRLLKILRVSRILFDGKSALLTRFVLFKYYWFSSMYIPKQTNICPPGVRLGLVIRIERFEATLSMLKNFMGAENATFSKRHWNDAVKVHVLTLYWHLTPSTNFYRCAC